MRTPTGVQVAASVAAKVRGYWEGMAVREERARLAEERRLKALAKATIRLVVGEWKKAVFVRRFSLVVSAVLCLRVDTGQHIREQDRLKAEEEERKRGREHLDDILGRSGQILEAQQVGRPVPVLDDRSQAADGPGSDCAAASRARTALMRATVSASS